MLCSEAELELSEDHDGIIDLPDDAPVGAFYAAYAKLDDPVIEISLTPNRPDCTAIRGIARDLAAAGLGTLRQEQRKAPESAGQSPVGVRLDLPGEEHLCPAFALRLVRGVKNGPSPEWMQRRLRAIGLRPIKTRSLISRIMSPMDRGRPLHVFDAAKVKGALVVRKARRRRGVARARRQDLYARFRHGGDRRRERPGIARRDHGRRAFGLRREYHGCADRIGPVGSAQRRPDRTQARHHHRCALNRFERGVDPNYTLPGLDLAAQLVVDLCGGEVSKTHLAGAIPDPSRIISFPFAETKRLSGLDLPRAEAHAILEQLGFHISGSGEEVKVLPPSWRPDIEGKADLVEEIVRIAGLDRIEAVPLGRIEASVVKPLLTLLQKRTSQARRALATRGLSEAVTWSFISREDAIAFGGGHDLLALANPIAAELSDMRPSLLPGLLRAAQRNADRGFGDVALFEVGAMFRG